MRLNKIHTRISSNLLMVSATIALVACSASGSRDRRNSGSGGNAGSQAGSSAGGSGGSKTGGSKAGGTGGSKSGGAGGTMTGGAGGTMTGGAGGTKTGGAGGTTMTGGTGGTMTGGSGGTAMTGGTGGTMTGGTGGTMSGGTGGTAMTGGTGGTAMTGGTGGSTTPPTITNGLVSYYNFDEASGTVAMDLSGNNNHGTLKSQYGTVNIPLRVPGRFGGALHIGTAANYVEIAQSATLDALLSNTFSVAAWVKIDMATVQWYTFVTRWAGVASDQLFHLATSGGGDIPHRFEFVSYDSVGMAGHTINDAITAPIDVWQHVASTYDGTTLRLYVNGIQVSSKDVSLTLVSNAHPTFLGIMQRDRGSGVEFTKGLKGTLDEVRIYNRALTVQEVGQLAQ
jgi:Concanavalin A-like lectin/glucanases superfamily